MAMVIPRVEWFQPYADFGANDIAKNIGLSRAVERMAGATLPERTVRERAMSRYRRDDFTVSLDWPYVDENDFNRTEYGRRIYYPVRSPNTEDFIRVKTMIGGAIAVRGFGELDIQIDLKEEEIVRTFGKGIYPHALLLRTSSGIYYSVGIVVGPEDHPLVKDPGVGYSTWKPGEPYEDANEEEGVVFVPVDLPSLKELELKLMEVEPTYVHEQIPLFRR